MTIKLTRSQLFVSAVLMLPAFMLGEWLSSVVGFKAFSFHDAYEGFWGALILATTLAFTRGEQ